MHQYRITFAAISLMLSAPLLAQDAVKAAPQISKRQLSECMTHRMSADRVLSYNDAAKACKDQLRGPKTDAALAKVSKPVG